jgi:putative tricarboxylic transport membrane protein
VPMLTLGIPGSATTAVMLGAFVMLDITPGPLLFSQRPDLVWGLIAALYIGNIMLLILNLPLVNLFIRILYLPMRMLIPVIVVIAAAGIFSVNYSILDLFELCFFGLLGDYMRRYGYPLAPVILGFVLGGRMEEAFRQSMIMHQGNILEIIERPIVSVFLLLSIVSLVLPPFIRTRSRRGLITGEAPQALPMEE